MHPACSTILNCYNGGTGRIALNNLRRLRPSPAAPSQPGTRLPRLRTMRASMKTLSQAEFTIIGTGLMGTSLALALRGKVGKLRGVDTNPANRYAAAVYFDEMGDDLQSALVPADVVILATPIKATLGLLARVGAMVRSGTLIIDLGSAKQQIVQAMDTLPGSVLAVGGHPM